MGYIEGYKEYDIWMEGYAATGEYATAQKLGTQKGLTFKHACHIFMCMSYLSQQSQEKITSPDRWDYDPARGSHWGCRLFDNEADARKAFG